MGYKYKFVRVELNRGFWTKGPKQDYREIVERLATEGWRFVQIFAPAISGYGKATYFELTFERPIE